MRDVVITGLGIVTAFGRGAEVNAVAMHSGNSAVSAITRFETDGLSTRIAASIDNLLPPDLLPVEMTEAIAVLAIEEAIAQSGLIDDGNLPAELVIGLPPLQMGWSDRFNLAEAAKRREVGYADLLKSAADPEFRRMHDRLRPGAITERLMAHYGIVGMPQTITTACSSGATAVIMATEAIRSGETDRVIVVASDASLSPEMLARFGKISALSTRNDDPGTASRPFDADRDGFVPGEGAAALVLETRSVALHRRASIMGVVEGIAEAADGYHRLRHQPDAQRIVDVMQNALTDAGLKPSDISYLNAHGTSTPENDRVEFLGCKAVFGELLPQIPVSSIKSMIGHTLSASGVIEVAASVLMLRDQVVYPTINVSKLDPDIQLDVVPDVARPAQLQHVLSNSFGFGGQNSCIVIGRDRQQD